MREPPDIVADNLALTIATAEVLVAALGERLAVDSE